MIRNLFIICLIKHSFAVNILFVSLIASPSHHIWNEALVEGLLTNGHNITKLGHFPAKLKNPNYSVLHVDADPFLDTMDSWYEEAITQSTIPDVISMWSFMTDMCNYCYTSDVFRSSLDYPKNFFDLIIFDITFSQCFYPLIDHFGTPPVVGVTPFGMQPYINEMIGHRTENYLPFYSLPYTDQMTFFERFYNVLHQKLEHFSKWYFTPDIMGAAKGFYGENILYLDEYEKSISLIFSNDDPVLNYPKALPPNVIPVGGIHVKKPQQLGDDIQKIMNKATEGVIFVSMGSNFQAKHYREEVKNAFIEAFSRLNLTIVWKFEGIVAPKNVVLGKWFSQTDILAHPNTKLFITHCGGLSSQETMIRGVPVVGVPLFMDQHNNGRKLESVKGGVILKYTELTADGLYNAITEVLSNPEYKQNMVRLSNLYQSQPQSPIEKFLLWTEYVLKNGHLNHLSVASRHMRWYQIDNWDIFAFSIVVMGVVLILLRNLGCSMMKICKKTNKKQKKH